MMTDTLHIMCSLLVPPHKQKVEVTFPPASMTLSTTLHSVASNAQLDDPFIQLFAHAQVPGNQ